MEEQKIEGEQEKKEEEEDEEEEEEEDLWQAVHALLEFRPLTSFESTDKVAASEKWYVSSSRLLLLLNRSLSGSLLTPLSITQIWGSTALFLLSRSPLLLRRSLSRSLLTLMRFEPGETSQFGGNPEICHAPSTN